MALLHLNNQFPPSGKVIMKLIQFVLPFGRSCVVWSGELPSIVIRAWGGGATMKRETSLTRTICLKAMDGHLTTACATKLLPLLLAVLWAAGGWPAFSQTNLTYAWTNFVGQPGAIGTSDGTGSAAQFWSPYGVAV